MELQFCGLGEGMWTGTLLTTHCLKEQSKVEGVTQLHSWRQIITFTFLCDTTLIIQAPSPYYVTYCQWYIPV